MTTLVLYLKTQGNSCVKLGEGSNGCVIDCNICNEINGEKNERLITKLTTLKEATSEMKIAGLLKKIDPSMEFIIYPLGICKVGKSKVKDFGCEKGDKFSTGLVQPYGGNVFSSNKYNTNVIPLILRSLIKGASLLESHGYIHGDIKPDNIVISDRKHVRFIDIGWVRDTDGFYDTIDLFSDYIFYPPEIFTEDASIIKWDKIDTWCIALSIVWIFEERTKKISDKMAGLLVGCLDSDPENRFNAKSALEYLKSKRTLTNKSQFLEIIDDCVNLKRSYVGGYDAPTKPT